MYVWVCGYARPFSVCLSVFCICLSVCCFCVLLSVWPFLCQYVCCPRFSHLCLSICPFVRPWSVSLSVCFPYLFVCLLFFCPSVCQAISLSVSVSTFVCCSTFSRLCLSIRPFVRPWSLCLSVRLLSVFVCLSFVFLSFCLSGYFIVSLCQSIWLLSNAFPSLSVTPSVRPSVVSLSVRLLSVSVRLSSVFLSFCQAISPSVCVSLFVCCPSFFRLCLSIRPWSLCLSVGWMACFFAFVRLVTSPYKFWVHERFKQKTTLFYKTEFSNQDQHHCVILWHLELKTKNSINLQH